MRPQRDPLTEDELLVAAAMLEVLAMAPPIRVARVCLFVLGEHHREATDRAALSAQRHAPPVERDGTSCAPLDGAPESQRAGAPPRALGSPSPPSDKSPLHPPVLAPAMFDVDTCPHDSAEPDGAGGAICNDCGAPVVGRDSALYGTYVNDGIIWMPTTIWALATEELPCTHCVAGFLREDCYRHGDPVAVVTARAWAMADELEAAPARPLPRPGLLIDVIDPGPERPSLPLHLAGELAWVGGLLASAGGAEPREGAAMVLWQSADSYPAGFGALGWLSAAWLDATLHGRPTLPAPRPDDGNGWWGDEEPDDEEQAVVVPLMTPEQVRRFNGPEGDQAAREAIAELEKTNPEAAAFGRAFEAAGRVNGKPRISAVPPLVPDPTKHRARALCPVCKADRPVGKDGAVQAHKAPGVALRCDGSGKVVDHAAAMRAAEEMAKKKAAAVARKKPRGNVSDVLLFTERVTEELRSAGMHAAADRVERGRPGSIRSLIELIGGQLDQLTAALRGDIEFLAL